MTNGQKEPIAVQEKRPHRLLPWPEDIERYFDRRMREFSWPFRRWRRPVMEAWFPDIDVFEREGKIVVRADVPGMKAEDLEVSVEGDLLLIKGHREEEKEVKEENYYCSERAFGEFSRTVRLPEGAAPDAIEAVCTDGVLEVSIPRPAEAAPKSVKVQVK
jgi:HSP20 family protein